MIQLAGRTRKGDDDDDDNGTNRSRNNMLMRPPLPLLTGPLQRGAVAKEKCLPQGGSNPASKQ